MVAPWAPPEAGVALVAPVVLVVSTGGVLIADVDDGEVEGVPEDDGVIVVVVEAVVSVVVVVVDAVPLGVVVVVSPGDVLAVDVDGGVVVVVLVVVLLRSQPTAPAARARAAAMGMRRFMNSPMCV